ncbi:MAG: metal ABC transporter solute-binding protein, Zn/Mn family [Pararhizobium sp.]
MRLSLPVLSLVAAAGLAVPTPAAAGPAVTIVAAENFYGEVAREISGPQADVISILSRPDEDPHLFEVTPSVARTLAGADIVIYNGAGYDPWMDKLLQVAGKRDRATIEAAVLVGAKAGANPHLWYEPKTFPAVAAALEAELARRDPSHAAAYEANLAAFDKEMRGVADRIAAIRRRHAGTAVTATEPVFGDMAAALGFTIENTGFQTAMMNDTEPTAQQVAAFEESLRNHQVRILFYNSQVSDQASARLLTIGKEARVPVVGVSETMPAGKTIATWLSDQLAAVEAALEKTQ